MYYYNNTASMVLNSTYAGPVQSTWAAGLAHMQTWPSLMTYSLPSFDFNLSMPACGLGFLTDPRYTIAQMQWNSMTGQGFGLGANGIFQGFGFGGYPGMNPMGLGLNGLYGGLGGSQGGGSANREELEEDRNNFENKYNNIKNFLKEITEASPRILPPDLIDDYNSVLKQVGKKKKFEEKFNLLNDFYKTLKTKAPTKIQEYITKYKFQDDFASMGFPGVKYDSYTLTQVNAQLKNIGGANSNTEHPLDDLLQVGGGNIINAISIYNTKYKPSSNDGIMNILFKAYSKSGVDKDIVKAGIKQLCCDLIDEATDIMDDNTDLDDTTKANIKKAIENLEQYSNNDGKIINSNKTKISDAFYALYVIARIAKARLVENQVRVEYNKFDENIGDFIMKKTANDIKDEGLEKQYNDYIGQVGIVGGNNDDPSVTDPDPVVPEAELTPQEKFEKLISDNIIGTTGGNKLTLDITFGEETINKGSQVYTAKTKYDQNTNKLVTKSYVRLKNGNFVEVTLKNSKYVLAENAAEITPEQMREMVTKAAGSIKSADELRDEAQNGKVLSGADFYEELRNNTSSSQGKHVYKNITKTLEGITTDNILEFMDSYYEKYFEYDTREGKRAGSDNRRVHEGIMERLDDERDRGYIKMESKLNFVKTFMDLCSSDKYCELLGTTEYLRIKEIYDSYTNNTESEDFYRDMSDNQTFNHTTHRCCAAFSWWSHSFGRFFGATKRNTDVIDHKYRFYDNEILDTCMRVLRAKMKAIDSRQQ